MEIFIRRFFSPAEVRQLESGLPRLGEWSSQMLVPFKARQLRRAGILWINRRWFLERQIDITCDDVRERVSSWLLHEFAYAIPQSTDPQDAFTSKTRTLHADRYGSSTGRTVHGGSGRVATIGCYQAKGVGVTPLVGAGANWVHSNGYCSVEEGIREAIFSEVAAAEFPHGAVPVVAILDTGLCFSVPAPAQANGVGPVSQSMRRAIIVRPAVLRLAHAERAPLFTRSLTGYSNSQLDDARRARDVVQRWSIRGGARQPVDVAMPELRELVSRIGEQVAFGQVHRLFSGGYFSSNLSVNGALLDFGGMRALPNWVNARTLDGVVGFGDEMKIVNKLIESLAFYFSKYRPASSSPTPAAALRSHAQDAHTRAFTRECLRMWNVDPTTDPALTAGIMQALRHYFSWQQKHQVNYKHGVVHVYGWLYDGIAGNRGGGNGAASIETQALDETKDALSRHFATFPDRDERCLQAWSSAARYLMPRETLDREKLQQSIERRIAVTHHGSSPPRQWVADLVQTAVGQGRRHWPRLPSDLTVQAQVAYEGSSVLLCLEAPTRRPVFWLEGIRVHDTFRLFDSCLTIEQARDIGVQSTAVYWTARVLISDLHRAPSIQIPEMQVEYRQARQVTAAREQVA